MDGSRKETLNFDGFSGYYGYMSYHEGYGGFNWYADFLYMNDSTWTNANGVGYQYGWCDTGYQNEAAMSSASSLGWIYQYGLMESANGRTFALNSMNAAASFSKHAVWDIVSYTENNGSLYVKAMDELRVSYTGKHVKLATLGNPDDFHNIAAVGFVLANYGKGGDTCTYGYPVVGAQLAIGDVKVTWSRKADLNNDHGKLLTPHLLHHQVHAIPHATAAHHAGDPGHGDAGHSNPHDPFGHHADVGAQFHLPATDHFF